MLKKLRNMLLLGFLLVIPVAALAPVANAQANINDKVCEGASLKVGGSADCSEDGAAQDSVNKLITNIVNIFSVIVGVVAVIMIIYGGFRYITSGGDSNGVTAAKNTILYAIIGLIIVALAQIIVKFVLSKAAPTS